MTSSPGQAARGCGPLNHGFGGPGDPKPKRSQERDKEGEVGTGWKGFRQQKVERQLATGERGRKLRGGGGCELQEEDTGLQRERTGEN